MAPSTASASLNVGCIGVASPVAAMPSITARLSAPAAVSTLQPQSARQASGRIVSVVPKHKFVGQRLTGEFTRQRSRSRDTTPAQCSLSTTTTTSASKTIKVKGSVPPEEPAKVAYLEGNSWIYEIGGLRLLVDPWLVGALDFGIPALYSATKQKLARQTIEELPEVDALLITQGFDDHAHIKTLKPLSARLPDLPVVAPLSAKPILDQTSFRDIRYINHGETFEIVGANGGSASVLATPGALLGPPWQLRENGYIVTGKMPDPFSIYYEPHCQYEPELSKYSADAVITPVTAQELPFFTLVAGGQQAVDLANLLKAKVVITCNNGQLKAEGVLTVLVQSKGTAAQFQELLLKSKGPAASARVIVPEPGKTTTVA